MRVNVAIPEAHVSAPVLDAALEATTRLNESLIRAGEVPPFDQVRDAIRWKPEPPGDEHFDHAKVVLGRKWGDCDDMAPYAAASMRVTGEDPGARAIVKKSGPTRWHAVVERSDGSIRDPSRETGMGQTNGVLGGALPLMMQPSSVVGEVGTFIVRPQLALRPVRDRSGQAEAWQARADLPWHWLPGRSPHDVAMVSLHASPVSSQAVVGACNGIIQLGEANDVDDELLDRAAAIRDMCDGATWNDVADEYGEDHATAAGSIVGDFFGLGKKFKRISRRFKKNPLQQMANMANPFHLVRQVPGVGPMMGQFMPTNENILKYGPGFSGMVPGAGPVASQAFQMASPMLQQTLLKQEHLPPEYVQPVPQMQMQYPEGFGYATQYGGYG